MPKINGMYHTASEGGFTITYVSLPDQILRRVTRLACREQKTTNELIREMVSREVETQEAADDGSDGSCTTPK